MLILASGYYVKCLRQHSTSGHAPPDNMPRNAKRIRSHRGDGVVKVGSPNVTVVCFASIVRQRTDKSPSSSLEASSENSQCAAAEIRLSRTIKAPGFLFGC